MAIKSPVSYLEPLFFMIQAGLHHGFFLGMWIGQTSQKSSYRSISWRNSSASFPTSSTGSPLCSATRRTTIPGSCGSAQRSQINFAVLFIRWSFLVRGFNSPYSPSPMTLSSTKSFCLIFMVFPRNV
jgi:hypothetical protein